MIDLCTSVSGQSIAVGAEIQLRISAKENSWGKLFKGFYAPLTKLDSSGDAKLNNNTLTFTVKVPGDEMNRKKYQST